MRILSQQTSIKKAQRVRIGLSCPPTFLGKLMNNLNLSQHPCANKCSNFKEDQCNPCLVAQVEKREFELGVAPDDAYVKTMPLESSSDFLAGDTVVIIDHNATNFIFTVTNVNGDFLGDWVDMVDDQNMKWISGTKFIRPASVAELQAKRRLTEAEQALAEVP